MTTDAPKKPNYTNAAEAAEKLGLPVGYVPFFGWFDGDANFNIILRDGSVHECVYHDDVPWDDVIAYMQLPDPEDEDDDLLLDTGEGEAE